MSIHITTSQNFQSPLIEIKIKEIIGSMLVMVLIGHILINNGGEMVTIIQGNITLPHQILIALRLILIPPDLLLMDFSEGTFTLLLSRER
jgi:hypothetical protein